MKETLQKFSKQWRYYHKIVCVMLLYGITTHATMAQESTVSGTVTDLNGETIIGVSVLLEGTGQGAVTDLDGQYSLKAPKDGVLVFSFIGFSTEKVPINGRSIVDISLIEDIATLSEVIVIGYGTQKKSDLTGAVASIKGSSLQQIATSDPNQALQGRAAGVQVTNNSGAPAAGQKVRVRGIGSLSNSSPLYVVDGFPTGDISNIAPTDIESIEVLKDASATAIYGSRGANGVIMVTTKRGKQGNTQFSVNSYYGVQDAWKQVDMLNAAEYSTLRLEAFDNGGQTASAGNLAKMQFAIDNNTEGTNWQNELFTQGKVQNHNVAISGGSEDVQYNISGTYFRNDGIVKNTYLEKLFTRANMNFKFSERISGGINLAISSAEYTPFNGSAFGGALTAALQKDPLTAARDQSTGNYDRSNLSDIQNPVRLIEESKNRTNNDNRVQAGLFLKAELIDGLSLNSQFTIDRTDGKRINYSPEFFITNNERRTESQLFKQTTTGSSWVNSNYLSYDKSFGLHNIQATAGIEFNYFENSYLQAQAQSVPASKKLWYIGNTRSPDEIIANDGESRYAIMSYFGRGNYTYDDRYLFTATVRWDGSSKFVGENRWGVFPSFSGGWNLHNEAFFPTTDILTQVKLRAGWGQVGNESTVGPYSYLTLFQPSFNYSFGGVIVPGSIPTSLANPDIRWETSQTSNVGAELGLFSNTLLVSADYFERTTVDFLYTQPTPGFAGALGGVANIGDLENKGFELQLTYNNNIGDFDFTVSANATHVQTNVNSLGRGEPREDGSEVRSGGATTRTEEGNEPGYFYALKTDGIFQSVEEVNAYTNSDGNLIQPLAQPGDIRYVDINSDGEINFASDRTKVGSPIPDLTYGVSAQLAYKGFDLNLLFTGTYGNEIANMMTFYLEHPSAGFTGANSYATRFNRWTAENPSTTEPRVTSTDPNQNYLYSDRYIEDGSYIRLKNIQLGYTLPNKISTKFGVNSLRIYVSADNLLTITDYSGFDPEIGNYNGQALQAGVDFASYPQARTFITGINIKF